MRAPEVIPTLPCASWAKDHRWGIQGGVKMALAPTARCALPAEKARRGVAALLGAEEVGQLALAPGVWPDRFRGVRASGRPAWPRAGICH